MRSFNSQEIANTLLAYAKMEHVDIALLQVRPVHTSFSMFPCLLCGDHAMQLSCPAAGAVGHTSHSGILMPCCVVIVPCS